MPVAKITSADHDNASCGSQEKGGGLTNGRRYPKNRKLVLVAAVHVEQEQEGEDHQEVKGEAGILGKAHGRKGNTIVEVERPVNIPLISVNKKPDYDASRGTEQGEEVQKTEVFNGFDSMTETDQLIKGPDFETGGDDKIDNDSVNITQAESEKKEEDAPDKRECYRRDLDQTDFDADTVVPPQNIDTNFGPPSSSESHPPKRESVISIVLSEAEPVDCVSGDVTVTWPRRAVEKAVCPTTESADVLASPSLLMQNPYSELTDGSATRIWPSSTSRRRRKGPEREDKQEARDTGRKSSTHQGEDEKISDTRDLHSAGDKAKVKGEDGIRVFAEDSRPDAEEMATKQEAMRAGQSTPLPQDHSVQDEDLEALKQEVERDVSRPQEPPSPVVVIPSHAQGPSDLYVIQESENEASDVRRDQVTKTIDDYSSDDEDDQKKSKVLSMERTCAAGEGKKRPDQEEGGRRAASTAEKARPRAGGAKKGRGSQTPGGALRTTETRRRKTEKGRRDKNGERETTRGRQAAGGRKKSAALREEDRRAELKRQSSVTAISPDIASTSGNRRDTEPKKEREKLILEEQREREAKQKEEQRAREEARQREEAQREEERKKEEAKKLERMKSLEESGSSTARNDDRHSRLPRRLTPRLPPRLLSLRTNPLLDRRNLKAPTRIDQQKEKQQCRVTEDSSSDSSSQSGGSTLSLEEYDPVHQGQRRPSSPVTATHDDEEGHDYAHGGADPDNVAQETEEKVASLENQVYEVANHLEQTGSVKMISLCNTGLDDDDLQRLSESTIKSPSQPVMLNLSLNNLTEKSVPHILNVLKSKPSIKMLILQSNPIGDDGARELVAGLESLQKESPPQRSSGHDLTADTVSLDSSVSSEAPPSQRYLLKELDLADSGLTDRGAGDVGNLLAANVSVETLSLNSNAAITAEGGWSLIADGLAKNKPLKSLTLDGNKIGDAGMRHLARGLYNNRTLTSLALEDAGIGEQGGKAIMEMLKRNTTILELTLSPGNAIPESLMEDIHKYIALNRAPYNTLGL
nr:hypothetical protein BaRGS_026928 [Batillaria attramentaria]